MEMWLKSEVLAMMDQKVRFALLRSYEHDNIGIYETLLVLSMIHLEEHRVFLVKDRVLMEFGCNL